MLSCKDFVTLQGDIIEGEKFGLWKRMSLKMHYFICHHCRRYSNQIKLVDRLSSQLPDSKPSDEVVHRCVHHIEQIEINKEK